MKGKSFWIKTISCILVTAMLGGLSWGLWSQYRQGKALQAALEESGTKLTRITKRYGEKKALATALLRSKQSLEGLLRGMQTKVKTLEDQNKTLMNEKGAVAAFCEKKAENLNKKIALLGERIEKIRASREEIIRRYKEKVEEIKQKDQKIAELDTNFRQTEYELKRTSKKLENCSEHNERLCMINEDLVEKYKNKGVTSILSLAEPMTQLRKVEMEKMVQHYRKEIDGNKLGPAE